MAAAEGLWGEGGTMTVSHCTLQKGWQQSSKTNKPETRGRNKPRAVCESWLCVTDPAQGHCAQLSCLPGMQGGEEGSHTGLETAGASRAFRGWGSEETGR